LLLSLSKIREPGFLYPSKFDGDGAGYCRSFNQEVGFDVGYRPAESPGNTLQKFHLIERFRKLP
jgi:hypothetical protein